MASKGFLAFSLAVIQALLCSVASSAVDQSRYPLKVGVFYITDSVNCHSTSLNVKGLLDYPSYVNDEEMAFTLKRNCDRVSEPARGVLGISDLGSGWSHSYVHLSPTTVFEKRGVTKKAAYSIATRGKSDAVAYFQCFDRANDCDEPTLALLTNRVHFIGRYFADVSKGLGDIRERHKYEAFIERLDRQLRATPVTGASCVSAKRAAELRLDSLRELATHLSGSRLFIPLQRENPL